MGLRRLRDGARAVALVRSGARHLAGGRLDEALGAYHQAIEIDPAIPEAWFDIGLVHKIRRDWAASLEANLRVVGLRSGPGEPGWWNAGIAATALRDWTTARRAWQEFGVDLPPGSGPIEAGFGPCPVRLLPDRTGEVVWGIRLDPCRIVIEGSIPLPGSDRRWRDVVLHDGAPNGHRLHHGREIPVFDELELWERSTMVTVEVRGPSIRPVDVDALVEVASASSAICEDWGSKLKRICEACSHGRPGAVHDHGPRPPSMPRLAVAGEATVVRDLIDAWTSSRSLADVTTEVVTG